MDVRNNLSCFPVYRFYRLTIQPSSQIVIREKAVKVQLSQVFTPLQVGQVEK
jgi:hypothetical protein